MKVAMLTPWLPEKTGIAHYASMIVPALQKYIDVDVIPNPSALTPQSSSLPRIYQLGNNPHHEWVYREAMRVPGVIVLHEIVLHHLIVEMTLARGDVEGYVAAMEANHGAAGAAWARGRAAGLHGEIGNFLFPASIDVANRSNAVIVHNRYAYERLRSLGVTTPIHMIPHPFEAHPEANAMRDARRAQLGYAPDDRVIGFFGFVTGAKRPEVVLQAFVEAQQRLPKLKLLVVGEPAPNVDVKAFDRDGITFTGYAPDEEFPAYVAASDRIVNLRYPTAGEASGILMRALDAGKPVAISDYGQFAEMPDDAVVKIPFGREVAALVEFFAGELPDQSAAQRAWIEAKATIDVAAQGYVRALEQEPRQPSARVPRALPLFPSLEATLDHGTITLRNTGDFTLRVHSYGQPGYRLIVKWDGGDRWIRLPGDLAPGAAVSIDAPAPGPLRLFHALESIPTVDPRPFAELTDGAAVR